MRSPEMLPIYDACERIPRAVLTTDKYPNCRPRRIAAAAKQYLPLHIMIRRLLSADITLSHRIGETKGEGPGWVSCHGCVRIRPRQYIPSDPHHEPPGVSRRPTDVRGSDASVPARLSCGIRQATDCDAFSLPSRYWALLRLARDCSAQRPLPYVPDRLGHLSCALCAGAHEFGLHFRAHVSRHRHWMGIRHGRTNGARPGPVEHPARASLLVRRIPLTLASRGGSACHSPGPRDSRGARKPIHDWRRGHRGNHSDGDHAWYVRDACSVRLNAARTKKSSAVQWSP